MDGNVLAQSGNKILEQGLLGALILLLFGFIFFFLFKFYLPQQAQVVMEKARLDAELQSNRDKYNQQQVDQLLALLKDDRTRFDSQIQTQRAEHARAYEMQREFFHKEVEASRKHHEGTSDRICHALAS